MTRRRLVAEEARRDAQEPNRVLAVLAERFEPVLEPLADEPLGRALLLAAYLDHGRKTGGRRADVGVERRRGAERLEHGGGIGNRHVGEGIQADRDERFLAQLGCARDEQVAELGVAAPRHDIHEQVGRSALAGPSQHSLDCAGGRSGPQVLDDELRVRAREVTAGCRSRRFLDRGHCHSSESRSGHRGRLLVPLVSAR